MRTDVDVVVVGGGICGVLAGQRLAEEGFTYKILEKTSNYGGVWSYRANPYSHLQAHAALYQWHKLYKLDDFPFKKCSGDTVLHSIRKFASDFGMRDHTQFNCEVVDIKEDVKEDTRTYLVQYKEDTAGRMNALRSIAVFVCSGILGKQCSTEDRSLPKRHLHSGLHMFAGKDSEGKNYLEDKEITKGKEVVILGSGAFGLEAMEAANHAGAKAITLVTRSRDRWIVPYSQQFKFVFLSHAPLVPRYIKCYLMQWWLTSLYKKCGIEHMMPSENTLQSFTGQCNDAFFQYPKQGIARFLVDGVESFSGDYIELSSGHKLRADILVIALGHEIQRQPSFLKGLQLDYTSDLHNFAFLGKNPFIGTASDWVWFNVPHGPQKQINSFISALKSCREGREKEVREALLPTPFAGCKGEPLNYTSPSGMQQRRTAYWRTQSAGLPLHRKIVLAGELTLREWSLWLLCSAMYCYESVALRQWLSAKARA